MIIDSHVHIGNIMNFKEQCFNILDKHMKKDLTEFWLEVFNKPDIWRFTSHFQIYDFETKVVENNFIFEAFKDYNATNNCSDILVKTINDNLGKQLGEQRRKLKKLMQEKKEWFQFIKT